MLLIICPNCGSRDESEFTYGCQAHVPYPKDPYALTDREWAEYLFYRDNDRGLFAERWCHSLGSHCQQKRRKRRVSGENWKCTCMGPGMQQPSFKKKCADL